MLAPGWAPELVPALAAASPPASAASVPSFGAGPVAFVLSEAVASTIRGASTLIGDTYGLPLRNFSFCQFDGDVQN